MYQVDDTVKIVGDNALFGFDRLSKHYHNGVNCRVAEVFYDMVSIELIEQPSKKKVSSILLTQKQLKAIDKG